MRRLLLTDRDSDVLRTLSLHTRMSSVSQVAECWWSDSTDPHGAALYRLRLLASQGWVRLLRATAIELPPLCSPLAVWRPGVLVPEMGPISWQLRRRWEAPTRATMLVIATPHAANQFGGRRRGRITRPFQVSHDLGVAAMYFQIRRAHPAWARLWIDEDRLSPFRRGEKLPDAILAQHAGAIPSLVLEFGGAYGKRRLEAFHNDCEDRGLPYQIW